MLPQGTEPLVLADGTKINPIDGKIVNDDLLVEVPNNEDIKREIVAARKQLIDLPVPPQQMNTISIIVAYSLFGISDHDIATVLSIPHDMVVRVKESDHYATIETAIVKNIMDSDLTDVRNMFVAKSRKAAGRMFDLLDSTSEATRLVASKDVLDRAGHRPADVIEHRHTLEGGLTIQYVEKTNDIPIIDVTPKEM